MAEVNRFPNSSPAEGAFPITPSNSADTTHETRGIYIGGAGNLYVKMVSGENCLFTGVLAGVVYPICVARVYSSNTTATNIVGLY